MYSKLAVPIIIGHPKRIAIINKKVSIVVNIQFPFSMLVEPALS